MARFFHGLLFLTLFPRLLLHTVSAADFETPAVTIPASYFGLHIHHLAYPTPTPWPSVSVPEWRLWDADVTWADLEPNRGEWQFAKLDRYVSLAKQHGTGILLPLGGCPTWAAERPPGPSNSWPAAQTPKLDDWRTFVRTVVTRYKGQIQAYEIWNEPNLREFWTGTIDQMLTLTKEASPIIHEVDPHAIVVSPSATADYGIPWLAEFLRKGGGQYADVIGYHFYLKPQEMPEELLPFIQQVRSVILANNLGNKPLWNTESGWQKPTRIDSEEVAGGVLARAYVLAWAAGVQRFYWYAWDNRLMGIVTYQEDEHRITPAGYAYGDIQQWLVGARMDRCGESAEHTWTCQLDRSGKKEWIVWNPLGNRKFDVPPAWHVRSDTPLLHDRRSLQEPTIDIGPIPTLLIGRS
ncbi:MAG TPA: beta-galactosidase [Candidatus Cybelea sp.]|nr:beta-galactosidase [Candidatus Cybelea sp.]